MEKQQLFKTGDKVPVSGNYRFVRHDKEVKDCFPRYGSYLHLKKGTKLPTHDDCLEPCIWSLMTVTDYDLDKKTKALV